MIPKNDNLVKVFISRDNSKTGIDSFNLLAGDASAIYNGATPKTAAALEKYSAAGINPGEACGTCEGNCPGCYAKRMTRYTDVFIHYAENTAAIKKDPAAVVAALETAIFADGNNPELFRIHDSGDFVIDKNPDGTPGEKSYIYFSELCAMIARHPLTRFGAYTKAREVVLRYGIENLPENFSLQCSPWEGHCAPIGDLPQFIYDDGSNPELKNLPHCPAVDKDGRRTGVRCCECRYCYNAKRGARRAVYAH